MILSLRNVFFRKCRRVQPCYCSGIEQIEVWIDYKYENYPSEYWDYPNDTYNEPYSNSYHYYYDIPYYKVNPTNL